MQSNPQQQYTDYVNKVLRTSESDPASLSPDEIRLALKHRKEMTHLKQIQQEMNQLRNQSQQIEARLRSLELQAADSQGKASGFIEYMISLKFPEVDAEPNKASAEPQSSALPTN